MNDKMTKFTLEDWQKQMIIKGLKLLIQQLERLQRKAAEDGEEAEFQQLYMHKKVKIQHLIGAMSDLNYKMEV